MRENYSSLYDFISRLEKDGELIRIQEEVSPVLEITEIADRVSKSPGGGKALLFENVAGSAMPVLINAFGSQRRMRMALGVRDIEDISEEIRELIETKPPKGIAENLALIPKALELVKIPPKNFKGKIAPCQEVVSQNNEIDLTQLPVLKCWPDDGGRFITLPLVFTRSPISGKRNVGVYRMQVYDRNTTGMHWHIHKDGAGHYHEYKKMNKRMELAVAIGTDPVVTYAATAPLPPGVDELLLAGFIRKKGVELVRCKTVDIEVPASSEIVLEGYVDPEETKIEGPFGDHTGYYSMAAPYPVFHITAITHKKDPIYSTTIVGKPPMEDCYMGKATERIFLPMLRTINPDIVDISLPWEGVFHNCAIVAIDKRFPFHERHVMNHLWGAGQMSFAKMILVVDSHLDIHNYSEVARHLFNHIDLTKDLYFSEGILDVLDHSSPQGLYGSKLGIEAISGHKEEKNHQKKIKTPQIPLVKETLRLVKKISSKVKEISIPLRNVKTPILFISLQKKKPHAAKEMAKLVFKDPNLGAFKIVIIFDFDVEIKNASVALWKFFNNVDPKRDFHFFKGRVGIDATRKLKEEGYKREWPDEIKMSKGVKKKISKIWPKLGIS